MYDGGRCHEVKTRLPFLLIRGTTYSFQPVYLLLCICDGGSEHCAAVSTQESGQRCRPGLCALSCIATLTPSTPVWSNETIPPCAASPRSWVGTRRAGVWLRPHPMKPAR